MTINEKIAALERLAWQVGAIAMCLALLWICFCMMCMNSIENFSARMSDVRRYPFGFGRELELEPLPDSVLMEKAFPAKKQRRLRTPASEWESYDRSQ